jgi:hypothetical protein
MRSLLLQCLIFVILPVFVAGFLAGLVAWAAAAGWVAAVAFVEWLTD